MKHIVEVADGAFFVPSYSEQTVIGYQSGITTQSGIVFIRDDSDVLLQEALSKESRRNAKAGEQEHEVPATG